MFSAKPVSEGENIGLSAGSDCSSKLFLKIPEFRNLEKNRFFRKSEIPGLQSLSAGELKSIFFQFFRICLLNISLVSHQFCHQIKYEMHLREHLLINSDIRLGLWMMLRNVL